MHPGRQVIKRNLVRHSRGDTVILVPPHWVHMHVLSIFPDRRCSVQLVQGRQQLPLTGDDIACKMVLTHHVKLAVTLFGWNMWA